MSDGAERVAHTGLGVDSTGVAASATLYDDGDATLRTENGDGLILEPKQVERLVAFLLAHEVMMQ